MIRKGAFLFFLALSAILHAQQSAVFWNVENLFDCRHDSLHDDAEFLPQGLRHWTPGRYWKKLDNVARTVAAFAQDGQWPMLVGMAEVENDSVMRDLTRRSPLRAAGYRYVVTDSPDVRGVDVALMYRPSEFTLIDTLCVRVPSAQNGLRPTRDILCARGVRRQGDTLCVVVVHLPSRASGTRDADRNRMLAAQALHDLVVRLGNSPVVVMGDFNAEPGDEIFRLLTPPLKSLMPQDRRILSRAQGTYVYKGIWGFLDHVLVNERLWPRVQPQARVAKFPFLLDKKGFPWRTFQGPRYQGGYSDHLPVAVDFR